MDTTGAPPDPRSALGILNRRGPILAYNPTTRFEALSAPVQGALWMCLAGLLFAFLNAVIRIGADQGLHPFQIAFLRSFFGLGFMLPWLLRMGLRSLGTKRPGIYLFRGLAATGAMICWMTSIATIPLAEATAISFAAPLLATIGSSVILEHPLLSRNRKKGIPIWFWM